MVDNKLCVMCEKQQETTWHTFMNCEFAKACWTEAKLDRQIENMISSVESLKDMVLLLIGSLPKKEDAVFSVLFWQIWRERNSMLWKGTHSSPGRTFRIAIGFLNEWEAVKFADLGSLSSAHQTVCKTWHKPEPGVLKINVDAAFFQETNELGLGMVMRDEEGRFVVARSIVKQLGKQ